MSKSENEFIKIPNIEYTEDMRPVSHEAFDNIVQNRRSVRVYTEEKVPSDIVEKVLQWALLAPTSSNLQCWEFHWVKDPEKRKALVEALMNQPAARTSQELIVAVARLDTWKRVSKDMVKILEKDVRTPKSALMYYKKLVPLAYNQGPMGIFGLIKKVTTYGIGLFRPIPREPNSNADMRVWSVKTTALACQNIMMGLSAYGYDSCPMEGYDSARVKKILGLSRKSEVVMVISAGKRAKNGVYGPRLRMPQKEFIKIH